MKKNFLLSIGIVSCLSAVTVAAFQSANLRSASFARSAENEYTLTLDSSNAPANLPANLSNQFGTVINSFITTGNGNDIPLSFTLAKAYNNGFVTLGNHGTMFNFGNALGRFKGLLSIKAVFDGSLTFEAGNYELQNGGAYFDIKQTLTSGTQFNLSNPMRYFCISAGDAYSNITSITLRYSCAGDPSQVVTSNKYVVENFNQYTATGNGYDTNGSGHNYYATTNLRSSLYGDYRNTGTDTAVTDAQVLSGTGWTTMGSPDYITYLGSLDGQSNVALLKGTNGNNMRYIQMKEIYGIPSIVGKGNTLSVKMHGGYTSTEASTATTQNVVVKMIAFYQSKFDKNASSNAATISEYTVFAGTGWAEYKMNLDADKEYYGFGFCLVMKGLSGAVYVPVDDVKIITENKTKTAPSGNYYARVAVSDFDVPVIISFADRINNAAIRINNSDAIVTSYSLDESGNFNFSTTGGYKVGFSTLKFGNITGKWDSISDTLINVTLSGNIKDYVPENGNITLSIPALNLDCDGDNSTMKSIFRRQYYGTSWALDSGNADRFSADVIDVATGFSSLRPRIHNSYRTGVMLNNDLNTKLVQSICMWIYNPGSEGQFINFTVYKTTNYLSAADSDRYVFDNKTVIPTGWSFYCMGFNHATLFKFGTDTLHNINLNVSANRVVVFDSVSLYD